MSELAIVAIILLAISIVIYTTVSMVTRGRRTVAGPRLWEIHEYPVTVTQAHGRTSGIRMCLLHADTRIDIAGVAVCDDSDFEEQYIALRVKAEDRATTLNRGLKP